MPALEWILVVEDAPGEAVLRRVFAELSPAWGVALVHDCGGFGRMKARLDRYRNASHVYPHVLLTDLDAHECPVKLLEDWGVQSEPPRFLFRVAVREIEAWLMGDRHGVAEWLRIPPNKVPQAPEAEIDPKARLLALARGSRSRRLVSEFCPAPGSRASQGPLTTTTSLSSFEIVGVWTLRVGPCRASSVLAAEFWSWLVTPDAQAFLGLDVAKS